MSGSGIFIDKMEKLSGMNLRPRKPGRPKKTGQCPLFFYLFFYYDQDYQNAVVSDAGADIIPSAKAQAAAKYFQYDQGQVAASVADDAANLYFASEHQSDNVKALVNHASNNAQIGQRG